MVFKSKGFRGTSLGDIAAAANTDRATLYYYIGGKAELFDEAVSGAVEANSINAEAIRNGPEAAPEKLRILINSLMKSYTDNYPLLYIFIQEHLGQVAPQRTVWSRRMRQLNRRYEDAIVGILRDGIDEGTIRRIGDPRIIAYGLLGMLGWTNRWFNPTDSIATYEEIGATFAAAFLDGVRAQPGESR